MLEEKRKVCGTIYSVIYLVRYFLDKRVNGLSVEERICRDNVSYDKKLYLRVSSGARLNDEFLTELPYNVTSRSISLNSESTMAVAPQTTLL